LSRKFDKFGLFQISNQTPRLVLPAIAFLSVPHHATTLALKDNLGESNDCFSDRKCFGGDPHNTRAMANAPRSRGGHTYTNAHFLIVFQLIFWYFSTSVYCTRGNRILFVHIPKCGGSSVKDAFRKMKSFTMWTNHAYNWDDYVARELRGDNRIPNNLIVEHHVASKPFAEAHRDIEILQKIWDERNFVHFSFVIVRDPMLQLPSLYSWCSRAKFNGLKFMLPKLWSNILSCVRSNNVASYLLDGKMCGNENHVGICEVKKMLSWFNNLNVYDLSELHTLRNEINHMLQLHHRMPRIRQINQQRLFKDQDLSDVIDLKLNNSECTFSKPSVKKITMERDKIGGRKNLISTEDKKAHLKCDLALYYGLLRKNYRRTNNNY